MRNIYRRSSDAVMELDYLAAHGKPKLCIEVRKRLVHHKHGHVFDYRPSERDALHLSARQLFGQFIQVRDKVELFRRFVHARFYLVRRILSRLYYLVSVPVDFAEVLVELYAAFLYLCVFRFDERLQLGAYRDGNFFGFAVQTFKRFPTVRAERLIQQLCRIQRYTENRSYLLVLSLAVAVIHIEQHADKLIPRNRRQQFFYLGIRFKHGVFFGHGVLVYGERECDVVVHRHLRIQRIALEHYRHFALAAGLVVEQLAL